MLLALLFRFLRLIITSIICSLPIYLASADLITSNGILFLSFAAFIIATGIDTYHFSYNFWKMKDFFSGLLLPLVIYDVIGFATCLLFRPFVFNRIFLPLRFAGIFGIKTNISIIIISISVIIIVSVLSFFRAKAGHKFYLMQVADNNVF